MTLPANIAAIESRHKRCTERLWTNRGDDIGITLADLATLLRAYRELAGELEAVSKSWDAAHAEVERLTLELQVSTQQAGELRDERGRLRASNEKLQRALRDIYKSECPDSLSLEDWQELTTQLQRKAMAALVNAQHPEQQPATERPSPLNPSREDMLRMSKKLLGVAILPPEQQPDSDARDEENIDER